MKWPGMLIVLLLAACAGGPRGQDGANADEPAKRQERRIPKWETFVLSRTEIRADRVWVVLPEKVAGDLTVSGLSSGWSAPSGKRTWQGSGECRLKLHELLIKCRQLDVTLVPTRPAPEMLLTAEGHVTLAHVSKGIGSLAQNLDYLFIRNEHQRQVQHRPGHARIGSPGSVPGGESGSGSGNGR